MPIASRYFVLTAAATVLACSLLGCGSENTQTKDGPTSIRLATFAGCDEYNLFWAMDKDIMKDHNLSVTLVSAQGGSAAIAAITSGAAEVAFANGVTATLSTAKGNPLIYIADSYDSAVPPMEPSNGVWIKSDSKLATAKDLKGKTVAVNELGGIDQLVTSKWLENEGVDPKDVNFVALPFAQMPTVTLDGTIDAFEASGSAVLSVPEGSLKRLADPYYELNRSLLFSGYLMTKKYFESHKAAAEQFFNALREAKSQTDDPARRDDVAKITSARCKTPEDKLSSVLTKKYTVTVSKDALAFNGELLVADGQIDHAPSVDSLIADFARVN